MRYLLLILFALPASACLAQSNDDVATLKALNAAFIHCSVTRDSATLSRIFADDIVLINPAGKRRTKQEMLLTLVSSPAAQSAEVDTVEVRLLGNVGLVMAHTTFTYTSNGKPETGHTGYLDVYEKRKGRWVAVACHVTSLNE